MFTIGDFAGHGRVSIRTLRHYDAIGLLRPAHVDPATGYRRYRAVQLARLHRIAALKELGLTLQQIAAVLDEEVGAEQLRGMLRRRRDELAAAAAAAEARLALVEARLRSIESEGTMPQHEVVVRSLPAVRLAELSGTAGSFDPSETGPLLDGLFAELSRRLACAGVAPAGPRTAWFEAPQDGGYRVTVHAGLPVAAGTAAGPGFAVVELPAVERAATVVHRGVAHGFLSTSQLLVRWVEERGLRFDGPPREVLLTTSADTIAELQAPLTAPAEPVAFAGARGTARTTTTHRDSP